MSTLQERIDLSFATLEDMVTKAEASKEENQSVREFAAKVNGLVKYVDNLNGSAGQIVEALGDHAQSWSDVIDNLRTIGAQVSKSSGLDRSAGDESVNALKVLSGAPLFAFDDTPELKAKADDLIARWATSAPTKSTRGDGSGTPVPELGFTVAVSCQVQGCGHRATTSKDNLNSIRRQAQVHARDTHKVLAVDRGSEFHRGITEALKLVMEGNGNAAEGGNFMVARVTA